MNRYLVVVVVLGGLLLVLLGAPAQGSWGAPAQPTAAPTEEPLPCDAQCTRTVEPLDVLLNDKVHVKISCSGKCPTTQKPIDLFFVVDRTNTMFDQKSGGSTYMALAQQGMISFINAMDFNTSSAGLITYAASDSVSLNLTHDRDSILHAINTIRRSEETDVRGLQGAFRTATQKLQGDGTPGNAPWIIVIAGGPDMTQANINMPTVTQAARNAGIWVAFLMFKGSFYSHYIEASSDCTAAACPRWQTSPGHVIQKYAWGVNDTGWPSITEVLGKTMVDLLLSGTMITQLQVREAMHGCAVFDLASSNPPPTAPQVPPYMVMDWIYPRSDLAGITIDYDAQMICEDTYPVTAASRMTVDYTNGQQTRLLNNPLVTVHGPITPSPTVATPTSTVPPPATSTPTASATATVPIPTTPVPSPSPTKTSPDRYPVYLPALLAAAAFPGS
jgi:hypothetical protein